MSPSVSKFELRLLSSNLLSLVSQLESTLTILHIYSSYYPSLPTIIQLLSLSDRNVLVDSVMQYCNKLWETLKWQSSSEFRQCIARMLALLDSFISTYLLPGIPDLANLLHFRKPQSPLHPSVAHQITYSEIILDPYYESLKKNFYFPLSPDDMPSPENDDTHMSMGVEGSDSASYCSLSGRKTSTAKQTITVEDSMDTISELIQEIQSSEDQETNSHVTASRAPPRSPSNKSNSMRVSLARKSKLSGPLNFLPLLRKFFHSLLSTGHITLLPIRNDSKISPIRVTAQVNELTTVGAKSFFQASRPNTNSIAGNYHLSTTLSFDELCAHPKVLDWMHSHGYHLVLNDCQSSDMIKIGFLARVHQFTWRDDLRSMIKDSFEWRENPFQFRLFFGSISSNRKGTSAPVLMVEVERENVALGLDFFCNQFDGDNALSPCGIQYVFFTLYQNTLLDDERIKIIHDINHHIGYYQLIRLYGLKDIDILVTIRQNVNIT